MSDASLDSPGVVLLWSCAAQEDNPEKPLEKKLKYLGVFISFSLRKSV
jgi:hypothetical protein